MSRHMLCHHYQIVDHEVQRYRYSGKRIKLYLHPQEIIGKKGDSHIDRKTDGDDEQITEIRRYHSHENQQQQYRQGGAKIYLVHFLGY